MDHQRVLQQQRIARLTRFTCLSLATLVTSVLTISSTVALERPDWH